jgi:hypothetical protein
VKHANNSQITLGNSGGIIGSFIFLEREAPTYPTGFGTSLAFGAAGVICVLLVSFMYSRHNKRYEGLSEEDVRERYTDEELSRMGDSSPLFVYKL